MKTRFSVARCCCDPPLRAVRIEFQGTVGYLAVEVGQKTTLDISPTFTHPDAVVTTELAFEVAAISGDFVTVRMSSNRSPSTVDKVTEGSVQGITLTDVQHFGIREKSFTAAISLVSGVDYPVDFSFQPQLATAPNLVYPPRNIMAPKYFTSSAFRFGSQTIILVENGSVTAFDYNIRSEYKTPATNFTFDPNLVNSPPGHPPGGWIVSNVQATAELYISPSGDIATRLQQLGHAVPSTPLVSTTDSFTAYYVPHFQDPIIGGVGLSDSVAINAWTPIQVAAGISIDVDVNPFLPNSIGPFYKPLQQTSSGYQGTTWVEAYDEPRNPPRMQSRVYHLP